MINVHRLYSFRVFHFLFLYFPVFVFCFSFFVFIRVFMFFHVVFFFMLFVFVLLQQSHLPTSKAQQSTQAKIDIIICLPASSSVDVLPANGTDHACAFWIGSDGISMQSVAIIDHCLCFACLCALGICICNTQFKFSISFSTVDHTRPSVFFNSQFYQAKATFSIVIHES